MGLPAGKRCPDARGCGSTRAYGSRRAVRRRSSPQGSGISPRNKTSSC